MEIGGSGSSIDGLCVVVANHSVADKNMVTLRLTSRLRRAGKLLLQRMPARRDAVVVASFGRAGSTLVYDAIARAMARARFGSDNSLALKITMDDAFDSPPPVFRRGVVYKTHDYPGILTGRDQVRAVFLFGSAVDAALSVHAQKDIRGEDWVRQHFAHLRCAYAYNDLLRDDVLGIREQCVAWMCFDSAPVLCLRYEGLWDNIVSLSEFCGVRVALPERRPRLIKGTAPKLLKAARTVYGPIDDDLAKLPDCFIAAPHYGEVMRRK